MPAASVVAVSRMAQNTECERLLSLFMAVCPVLRLAWPAANSWATSSTAAPKCS